MTDPILPASNHDDEVGDLVRLAGVRPLPSPAGTARARDAAYDEWRRAVRRHRLLRMTPAAAAALAAAAAVLFLVARTARGPQVPSTIEIGRVEHVSGRVSLIAAGQTSTLDAQSGGASIPEGAIFVTPDAGRLALRLDNGASLRLDEGTRFALLDGARMRLDSGAVYVDSNGVARVEILTPMATVRNTGTRFELRVSGAGLRVRVRRGVVRVDVANATHEATEGVQIQALADGSILRASSPSHGPEWDWITLAAVPFEIEGRTLAQFLDWVAREGGWRVSFRDPSAARVADTIILHGSIDGLTPADALAAVLPTTGFTHRTREDEVILARIDGKAGRR
ncbi:MAG TPA: FecR domain-containing protein [Vicinamibacterales bacterium]|nr:FecR domain-containing protein [Vicinamibacterales bacterium]